MFPSDPRRESVLADIERGRCPWCSRTSTRDGRPFKLLGQHFIRSHGVDLVELRDELVVGYDYPFASSVYTQELSVRSSQLNTAASLKSHHWSGGGRHSRAARLRKAVVSHAISDNTRLKMSNAATGRVMPFATRLKLSASLRSSEARRATYESPEYREKLRQARLGKIRPMP